jgi:hypothetical protein
VSGSANLAGEARRGEAQAPRRVTTTPQPLIRRVANHACTKLRAPRVTHRAAGGVVGREGTREGPDQAASASWNDARVARVARVGGDDGVGGAGRGRRSEGVEGREGGADRTCANTPAPPPAHAPPPALVCARGAEATAGRRGARNS